jgi:hypothetical protein
VPVMNRIECAAVNADLSQCAMTKGEMAILAKKRKEGERRFLFSVRKIDI